MVFKRTKQRCRWIKAVSYSLFFGLFFFFLFSTFYFLLGTASANELIEQAFAPAKLEETIIDLGNTKDAVGNEIFRESVGTQKLLGK